MTPEPIKLNDHELHDVIHEIYETYEYLAVDLDLLRQRLTKFDNIGDKEALIEAKVFCRDLQNDSIKVSYLTKLLLLTEWGN